MSPEPERLEMQRNKGDRCHVVDVVAKWKEDSGTSVKISGCGWPSAENETDSSISSATSFYVSL